jgi:UDP-N-acetylglucosamine--N-acetylmuramyl-(pentapeptide) pyrophosphoryl-undecaprenol N-acetylglucosamine transferase
MRVLIAAGGTGGHIYPGIAIAKVISENEEDVQIKFVGTKKGMERIIVPKAGYHLETIRVKGFERKISMDTVRSLKELFMGMLDAKRLIENYNPDIVIGMGGYVCGPVLLLASRKKIPTMIHEQNAFPGATNKLLSRFVDKIAISFSEAKKYFGNENKVFLSGNPVRKEFFNSDRKEAREKLGFGEDDFVVVSSGGSLGAASINNAMLKLIKEREKGDRLKVVHITGKANYEDFMDSLREAGLDIGLDKNVRILEYCDKMHEVYACADLVVSRAGAMSVAELAAGRIPSILVPYPYATDNHQGYNARSITDEGGGILILDSDLKHDPEILKNTIYSLIEDPEKLSDMGLAASKKAMPEADIIFYREMKKMLETGDGN